MRTQFYVPGTSYLYVGLRDPASGAVTGYAFLGFCESEVQVSMAAGFEDVMVDYSGPMVPADSQFMGESGFVGGTVVRYNEEVLANIMVRAGNLVADNTLGTGVAMTPGAVGSLMVTEGFSYPLVIASANPALKRSQSRLARGYTFFNAWIHDNFDFGLGNRVKKPRCLWRALPQFDECSGKYVTWAPTIPNNLPACNTG